MYLRVSINPVARGMVAVVGVLYCIFASVLVSANDQQVEVAAEQTATVVGTFDSLAALVGDLCTKAGVELRAYDAPDRPITANHKERSLVEMMERLLSQENYLLGLRGGESDEEPTRVVWIRVTGAKSAAASALQGGIAVPSHFGATDFEHEASTDTQRAQEAVAERLLSNEAKVAQFLTVEPREVAQSLRQYPHIDALLRKLRAEQHHPAVTEKLDAVIDELAALGQQPSD